MCKVQDCEGGGMKINLQKRDGYVVKILTIRWSLWNWKNWYYYKHPWETEIQAGCLYLLYHNLDNIY